MDGSSAELAGLEARFRRSAPSFEELGARAAALAGSSRAPGPERAYRSDRRRSSFAAIHRKRRSPPLPRPHPLEIARLAC